MAPPLVQRARAYPATVTNHRVPFHEVAHLSSLSLLRAPSLARSHPKGGAAHGTATEGCNAFKQRARQPAVAAASPAEQAQREELRRLEKDFEKALLEEQRAQKQSEQDIDLRDFYRSRANLAEESIAKIVDTMPTEDDPFQTLPQLSHSRTWGPSSSSKWTQGFDFSDLQATDSSGLFSKDMQRPVAAVQSTQLVMLPAQIRPQAHVETEGASLLATGDGAASSQAVLLPSVWAVPQVDATTGASFLGASSVEFPSLDADDAPIGDHHASSASSNSFMSRRQMRRHMTMQASLFSDDRAGEITHVGTIDEWIARRHSLKGMAATGSTNIGSEPLSPLASTAATSRPGRASLSFLPSREPQRDPDEEAREAIRFELKRLSGGCHGAFRKLDLSGSRQVSYQEFTARLDALCIPWQELTGLRKPRDLFKLFDLEGKGYLTRDNLFPETKEKHVETRVSTPDFWNQYCRGTRDISQAKGPVWEEGADKGLQTLLDGAEARQNVSERRKWIAATMRRLKHQGKSDARCREVCARHLPKGTGPKDREDVPTFSDSEVKNCKKYYSERVNAPVRNIQKTVYEMREQRKVLQTARQTMQSIAPQRHNTIVEARHTLLDISGLNFFASQNGDDQEEAVVLPHNCLLKIEKS